MPGVQVFDGNGRHLAMEQSASRESPGHCNQRRRHRIRDRYRRREITGSFRGLAGCGRTGPWPARIGRYGNYDGQFLVAHGVAVGKGGEVYVADFTGKRVQKFMSGKAQ